MQELLLLLQQVFVCLFLPQICFGNLCSLFPVILSFRRNHTSPWWRLCLLFNVRCYNSRQSTCKPQKKQPKMSQSCAPWQKLRAYPKTWKLRKSCAAQHRNFPGGLTESSEGNITTFRALVWHLNEANRVAEGDADSVISQYKKFLEEVVPQNKS